MSCWDTEFDHALATRARLGLRREAVPAEAALNFSSNDYLGLARHPLLAERAARFARLHGTGATASRLVCGTLEAHQAIEARLAALKGQEAAMLLASGWQANTSVLAALLRLAGPEVQVFSDALNHASLIHGIRAAGVRARIFRHNDLAHLAALLAEAGPARRLIVTESVFSMDGDCADIAALRDLAAAHGAFLYVDEAHATGVLGRNGMGLCAGVPGIDLVMGTFSKALGSFGAYVAGSRTLIGWLQNECAGFIYTTALPPPVLGAIDAALDLVPTLDAERARLAASATRLRAMLAGLGADTGPSTTQIVPMLVGDAASALALASQLRARGILAVAIRPPTVPDGTSRIRFALSAAHDGAALDQLYGALREC